MSGSTEFETPETLDANAPPDDAPAERQISPRDQIMMDIAAKREAQIVADNAQAAIYDREATEAGLNFPTDDPEPNPEPAARDDPAPSQQAALRTESIPPPTVPAVRTLNVDGRDVFVSDEQLLQLAQLGMVANVALHQYQQPAPAPQEQPAPAKPIIDAEAIRQTVEKMQYGGVDDGVAALTHLIEGVVSRVPQQQIDPNAIVHQAVAAAEQRTQLAQDTAVIRQEYGEIFGDPDLSLLAARKVDAIRQRDAALGQRRPDLDIYREAGNEIYAKMRIPLPGAQPQQSAPGGVALRADVVERKRNAPRATATVDMRMPAPVASRAPTGSDIVEQMRKARGQASMR